MVGDYVIIEETIEAAGVRREYMIKSSSVLASLPECVAGSTAYTADLSYMAQYDGENWVQMGG